MAASALILTNQSGDTDPMYGKNPRVSEQNCTLAKCDGDKTTYVVYRQTDYDSSSNKDDTSFVVDSREEVHTGWPIQSFQSEAKTGIILCAYKYYGSKMELLEGTCKDITGMFPIGPGSDGRGLSSFIVNEGTWSMYKSDSTKISIDGKEKFGPGDRVPDMVHLNDVVKSVVREA